MRRLQEIGRDEMMSIGHAMQNAAVNVLERHKIEAIEIVIVIQDKQDVTSFSSVENAQEMVSVLSAAISGTAIVEDVTR
jgi:hypothetical protein